MTYTWRMSCEVEDRYQDDSSISQGTPKPANKPPEAMREA